ncbi:MAG: hypothetical protein QXR87_07895 [Candidatus Hadarchaeales archaeon]
MVRKVVPIGKKERRRLTVEITTPSSKRILRLLPRYSIFIPGLTRRSAHYLAKRLSLTLGREVETWPATFGRKTGYLFASKNRTSGTKSSG